MPSDEAAASASKHVTSQEAAISWVAERWDTLSRVSAFVVAATLLLIGFGMWTTGNLEPRNFGYGGLFLFSIVASGTIILPLPGLAALCLVVSPPVGLNPIAAGLAAALGQTIGEVSAYMIGYTGSGLAQKNRYYDTVHSWVIRWGAPVILVLSVVPFGLFDLAGISAGSLRYPVRRFVPVVLVGKIIKSLIFAYGCAWGAEWVGDFV